MRSGLSKSDSVTAAPRRAEVDVNGLPGANCERHKDRRANGEKNQLAASRKLAGIISAADVYKGCRIQRQGSVVIRSNRQEDHESGEQDQPEPRMPRINTDSIRLSSLNFQPSTFSPYACL